MIRNCKSYIGLLLLLTGNEAFTQPIMFDTAICIARITGAPAPQEQFKSPNTTHIAYNVGGSDLGIIWEIDKRSYGIFFGDTYGRHHFEPPVVKESDWRCNVLAFSKDQDLDDGLTIDDMTMDSIGNAKEIVPGGKDKSGMGDWTSIPTGAIQANGAAYVHYMNVRHWNTSNWGTNYSALYRSKDKGMTWKPVAGVRFDEDSNFGQVGYFKKDGYVYMIGTESGRQSAPRLARFKEQDIEDQQAYEFWNGGEHKWIKGQEHKATNLFNDATGELSFIYHKKSHNWILLYFNEKRYEICARYTTDLTGEWSAPQRIAHGKEYPKLYGSYIHPISAEKDAIYFLMSLWNPYNVFMMRSLIKY